METLSVSDGTYTWSEQRTRKEVKVVKSRATRPAEQDAGGGGAERLEAFRDKYDLRVLPERDLGGRAAWVLEGRPREELEENGIKADRALFYFDKQTGILVIMALLDRKDRPLLEVKFNDIQVNPELPASTFDYTPPEGVEVVDKTRAEESAD
jgi:outer membrane lipoprotein-sorting protein